MNYGEYYGKMDGIDNIIEENDNIDGLVLK